MPTTQVQFRRGNTAQNLAFTGALGEVTVDTTVYTMRVHDGVTPGGYETTTTSSTQTLTNKTLNNPTINSPTLTGNITGGANLIYGTSLISITGNITAGNLSVTGAITGTINPTSVSASGNVTGGNLITTGLATITGNVTGGNLNTAGLVSATGNVTGNFIVDAKGELRKIPLNSQTTSYSLILTDAGKCISSNANVTVPASIFSAGDSVSVYNNSAASITIVQGSGVTMYNVGTASTGNRTLAQRGLATVVCVAANTFVATGGGLS